jgi:2-dehydropantoate 2-reductase
MQTNDGKDRRAIAVMGAGAVGCYFGGMLARAGAHVTLIGRPQHVDAMNRNGLLLESKQVQGFVPVSASTDVAAIRDAQLVLLCVKTLDTESAATALAPHLADGALVLSFQNGVDNVDRIHAATGVDAVPAVVYVGAEMAAPGHVKHTARGDLVIGNLLKRRASDLPRLAELFVNAGVPCRISDNIEGELWTKLAMNCAYNPISALTRSRYGRIVGNSMTRELLRRTTEEIIAVANAAGVRLSVSNLLDAVYALGAGMLDTLSSTAQDLERGKRTEIDSLNGYVVRRGAELGIDTPVNQTLHALIKVLEEAVS